MTTIGCTGHQTLSAMTRRRIAAALAARIATVDDEVVGLSSLAAGADQVFAHVMLASGGRLHVVIPCHGYAETFDSIDPQRAFRHLLAVADEVTELRFPEASEEAFMAAGRAIADRSDLLLAVWDGKPAAGLGGTADVVAHAKRQGTPVEIVWPVGARRS
jgi:hypothetical protein